MLVKVLYKKENDGKNFLIVDGAMNDLLRPSLYNAFHNIVSLKDSQDLVNFDIVGPICESGDFLGKDRYLPNLDKGDLLVVKDAGAYGFSMSSNYNSRLKPAEVALINSEVKLIRKRESFEDLIRDERV